MTICKCLIVCQLAPHPPGPPGVGRNELKRRVLATEPDRLRATVPHTSRYGMVWCGVVWCGVVWYGVLWYCVVLCGRVWKGTVSMLCAGYTA